jgi:hypothetical protein
MSDKPIKDMTDDEIIDELDLLTKQFTDADFQHFENVMILRAYVLGWTGDPLNQPARSVLAAARQVIAEGNA